MFTKRLPHKKAQQGLGLISAIFVITLMAVIATGISRIVITQQQSHGQQTLSLRATLAAETGIEYVLTELAAGKSCQSLQTQQQLKAISGCQFTARCDPVSASLESQIFIESEGQCGFNEDIAIRHLQRQLPLETPEK